MDSHKPADRSETSSHNASDTVNNVSSEQLPTTIVPPYWQHMRAASRNSILSIGKSQPIRLEDNTEEEEGAKSPLWARLVSIDSHTVVTGNVKGVGDYVVWICRVQTLDVSTVARTIPSVC